MMKVTCSALALELSVQAVKGSLGGFVVMHFGNLTVYLPGVHDGCAAAARELAAELLNAAEVIDPRREEPRQVMERDISDGNDDVSGL